ncbi:hypothetical protein X943_001909 [Babesia divergens]|uniref:Uncharacterized protein n=1 Tax=Babesia divergens TaxID=32595 RepID=A0AAD9LHF8_BABDI|nr:hypothetical protein X943_001909 [Babesia divergens]
MNHVRGLIYRRFWKANLFQGRCVLPLRHFHSGAHEDKSTHTQRPANVKNQPSIHDYYSRGEIAALFLQPFCIIVAYLLLMWQIFKYHCNIRSLDDVMRTLRWKYRAHKLTREDVD